MPAILNILEKAADDACTLRNFLAIAAIWETCTHDLSRTLEDKDRLVMLFLKHFIILYNHLR